MSNCNPLTHDSLPLIAVLTETGILFKFDVDPGQTIAAAVALHTAIAVHDQILIDALGEPVSESQLIDTLSQPVFVLSRRTLHASKTNLKKASVRIDFVPLYEYGVITGGAIGHIHYDSGHFHQYIRSISQGLQLVLDNSQRQLQGLRVALMNLDKHFRAYDAVVEEFSSVFSNFSHQTESITMNFEEYIRRLSLVEIHPSLSRHEETLLDKVSEGKLRSMIARHHKDHEKITDFVTQIYQQRKTIIDACRGETDLLEEPETSTALFCFPFTPLHHLRLLSKSFLRVVAETVLQQTADAKDPINAAWVSRVIGDRLSNLLSVEQFQLDMMDFIRNRLCSVSDIQARIHLELKRLQTYNEILSQKLANLSNLRAIGDIPEAYLASLMEILRRRSYVSEIRGLAENVERLRADEIKARTVFMEEFGQESFREVIMELDRQPPQYFLPIESMGEDLPCIESIADIQLPANFQPSDKLLQMVRRCGFDDIMISNLPLAVRKEISEKNSKTDRDEGTSILNICTEGNVDEAKATRISSNVSNERLITDLTAENKHLRAALLEKDKRIAQLESEQSNLTMSTAVLYQENKTLTDMLARSHVTLSNFKEGDLVAVPSGCSELLNMDCSGYHLTDSLRSLRGRRCGRIHVGIVKSISIEKDSCDRVVDVEFFGTLL